MDDFTQNILLALLVLFVVHQISFRLLMDPAKYQERVTLRAVHRAFLDKPDKHHQPDALLPYRHNLNWDRLLNVYDLKLHRDAPRKFADLRSVWGIDEAEYTSEVRGAWASFGDAAGLSGSLFFHSRDKHFLLKSLGRAFENAFLHEHFLPAYFDYAHANPRTHLNRVLDVLCSFDHRLGEWLLLSPGHFLVLENIARGAGDGWETLDLKPTAYLEPFRDLVPERIQGSGVTDVLPPSKPLFVASPAERDALLQQLEKDAAFLAELGAIDWSVLVVRPPDGLGWRVALIDVFWSLRTPRAHFTKRASDAAGVPTQTVTADAEGYAKEVVRMMERAIRVRE